LAQEVPGSFEDLLDPTRALAFEENQRLHHGACFFKEQNLVDDLAFHFLADGRHLGRCHFQERHQSYEGIAHGGLIAAIVDAAMTQCLFGHGVVAYTVDLSLRYRKPVPIGPEVTFETRILESVMGKVWKMECRVLQGEHLHVEATAKFFIPLKSILPSIS
jgi:acyl-coenzyme A thioesterase PaaI-like protein